MTGPTTAFDISPATSAAASASNDSAFANTVGQKASAVGYASNSFAWGPRPTSNPSGAGNAAPLMRPQGELSTFHHDLQRFATSAHAEPEARAEFCRIIIKHTGVLGAAHLTQDRSSAWQMGTENVTGRVPQREDFVAHFIRRADSTLQRGAIQIEHFLGVECIFAPVQIFGVAPEVLLVLSGEGGRHTHCLCSRRQPPTTIYGYAAVLRDEATGNSPRSPHLSN